MLYLPMRLYILFNHHQKIILFKQYFNWIVILKPTYIITHYKNDKYDRYKYLINNNVLSENNLEYILFLHYA